MEKLLIDHRFYNFGENISVVYINSAITSATSKNLQLLTSAGTLISTTVITTSVAGVASATIPVVAPTFADATNYKFQVDTVVSDLFRIDYRANLIAAGLDSLLTGFLNIPVYSEIGNVVGSSLLQYTFENWVLNSNSIQVRRNNQDLTIYTDYHPDYNGQISIKSLTSGDDIYASYKFRLFSELDFGDFLTLALSELNSFPPATTYTFSNSPTFFDPYLTLRTYSLCLQRILLDLEFWNNRLIFPEPSGLRQSLNAMYIQASTEAKSMLQSIKARRFISPRGITSFRLGIPYRIDNVNYRLYTVASLSGTGNL